jgi:catechol 2,3-dioxygenase-like lactoylglutathione lyase family enzyme
MDFHHVCVVVADTEEALKCYRDLLRFRVIVDVQLPDGPGRGTFHTPQQLDEIFRTRGSSSRMIMLRSKEGALIELQGPAVPAVQRKAREQLRYGHTGIAELAFAVEDIDDWFERVKARATRPRPIAFGSSRCIRGRTRTPKVARSFSMTPMETWSSCASRRRSRESGGDVRRTRCTAGRCTAL